MTTDTALADALGGLLQGNPIIEVGLPAALAVIMVGVGLTLRPRDFRNTVRRPAALVLGSLGQMILLPLAAFAIALLLGLPPMIAIGLVIIAACPGGTISNVLAFIARGNLALSILMTALSSLVTVLTLPLFTNIALGVFADTTRLLPARLPVAETVSVLLLVIFVPVVCGMALRAWKVSLAGRIEGIVSWFGIAVLVTLVAIVVYQARHHVVALLIAAGPPVIALNLLGIAVGFAAARLAGGDRADGLTLAIELGVKNTTVGLMVTLTLLGSAEIAIPSMLFALVMFASSAVLVAVGRRQAGLRVLPAQGEVPAHVPDDVTRRW